eukprot:3931546-Karenia_brevis.AAC.1
MGMATKLLDKPSNGGLDRIAGMATKEDKNKIKMLEDPVREHGACVEDGSISSDADNEDLEKPNPPSSVEAKRRFLADHDTTDEDEDGERRVKRGEVDGGTG